MKNYIFIITGTSGAGKSQALKCFEDFGFHCIDNIPVKLLPHLADLIKKDDYLNKVALGIDIREAKFSINFNYFLKYFDDSNLDYKILFFDCDDRVLFQRFSETRHRHPLGENLTEAIKKERNMLEPLKEKADKIIDTTKLTLGELKEVLSSFVNLKNISDFKINIVSFGYKYGIPLDADIVMDVRFIPNPYYEKNLKAKTGLDAAVKKFLNSSAVYNKFVNEWTEQLKKLIPLYIKEGKSYLTIAIGCTGGRHRSVAAVDDISKRLSDMKYDISEFHRDMRK
ncbi:MAG: RNase adapter RapZ [Elusimicrobia bacterium]|nr:RNase adapter RapZ [Elusimicrobiota bacterium]